MLDPRMWKEATIAWSQVDESLREILAGLQEMVIPPTALVASIALVWHPFHFFPLSGGRFHRISLFPE